jgi:hypothetical protein
MASHNNVHKVVMIVINRQGKLSDLLWRVRVNNDALSTEGRRAVASDLPLKANQEDDILK